MKKNVLLVEDDPALRMVVREVLKSDFNIDEADNGEDGINKGLNSNADLVILDKDPRTVAPDEIKDIGVMETWMDGTQVYKA